MQLSYWCVISVLVVFTNGLPLTWFNEVASNKINQIASVANKAVDKANDVVQKVTDVGSLGSALGTNAGREIVAGNANLGSIALSKGTSIMSQGLNDLEKISSILKPGVLSKGIDLGTNVGKKGVYMTQTFGQLGIDTAEKVGDKTLDVTNQIVQNKAEDISNKAFDVADQLKQSINSFAEKITPKLKSTDQSEALLNN